MVKRLDQKFLPKKIHFFFHKKHIEKAQNFYNKYGNKTIFLARFVPIVRTFAPIVAGVGQMKYKNFITYNLIGGFIWSFGMIFAGYFLGQTIPNVDKYILPIIIFIIIISFLPIIFEIWMSRKKNTTIGV